MVKQGTSEQQKDLNVLQKLKKDTFTEKTKGKTPLKFCMFSLIKTIFVQWAVVLYKQGAFKGSTQIYHERREYSDRNETKRCERLFLKKNNSYSQSFLTNQKRIVTEN